MLSIATVMYRNPLEEWLWESGVMFWVVLIVGIIVVPFFIGLWIAEWRRQRRRK